MAKTVLHILTVCLLLYPTVLSPILNSPPAFGSTEPNVNDPHLRIEAVFKDLTFPTSMAFLGPDDILVLEKENGTVHRIVDGKMLQEPLLDVNVATKQERGMLGIAVAKYEKGTHVFLYYTESRTEDGDDEDKNIDPIGNRLYRYELVDNKLINPKLLLEIPAMPNGYHQGGVVLIGPDTNLYLSTGDVNHHTKAQNIENGPEADGTGGILTVAQGGQILNGRGILGDEHPLNMYYAYGIRNSFGIDFDPLTGNLWDTENGPWYGDEINLVEPGFNSGWNKVQGIWEPAGEYKGKIVLNPKLVDFDGKGKYSDPELMWNNSVGLSTIKFFNSDAFGEGYKNDLFVGNVNEQVIYHFELNDQRTGLDLSGQLSDKIAHNADEVRPYRLVEGIGRVTDLEVGPDGNLYILSHNWDREPGKTSGMISRLISNSSASMDTPKKY